MSIVWHSKETRQLFSIQGSRGGYSRDISIKLSYVLFHQIDIILTVAAISFGLTELNPVIRNLLATPIQLVVFKVIIPILIAWLVPGRLLLPALALISLVVLWNIKELLLLLF